MASFQGLTIRWKPLSTSSCVVLFFSASSFQSAGTWQTSKTSLQYIHSHRIMLSPPLASALRNFALLLFDCSVHFLFCLPLVATESSSLGSSVQVCPPLNRGQKCDKSIMATAGRGYKRALREPWISEHTWKLMSERNTIHQQGYNSTAGKNALSWNALPKTDQRDWLETEAEEANLLKASHNIGETKHTN